MKGLGFLLVLAAFALGGCGDSGQTGSPSCAPPESCACHALVGYTLAKATVSALDQDEVRLELEELLTPSTRLSPADLPRTIVGSLTWAGCTSSANPKVGDSVLSGFIELSHCSEYEQCVARKCQAAAVSNVEACATSCEPECDPAEIPVTVWQKPWAESIDVGESAPVTIADAIALTDQATCDDRYPPPPSQPCNDVIQGNSGCSMSHSTHSGWATAALALLGLGLFGARRRRLMRRSVPSTLTNEEDGRP